MRLNFIKPEISERMQFLGYNELPAKLTYYDAFRWLEMNYGLHLNAFSLVDTKYNRFTGLTWELMGENENGSLFGLYILDDDPKKKYAKTCDDLYTAVVEKIFDSDDIHQYLMQRLISNSERNKQPQQNNRWRN